MAPATELGRDDPETRRTSMVDLLGFPSRSSHPHPDIDHSGWSPSGSPFDDVRGSSRILPGSLRVPLVCGMEGVPRKRKRHVAVLDTRAGRSVYSPPMTSAPHSDAMIHDLQLGPGGSTV